MLNQGLRCGKCRGQLLPATIGGMIVYCFAPRSKRRIYRCRCSRCGLETVRKLKDQRPSSTPADE
jgi:hypothetical protein